jgi:hypothetical protein
MIQLLQTWIRSLWGHKSEPEHETDELPGEPTPEVWDGFGFTGSALSGEARYFYFADLRTPSAGTGTTQAYDLIVLDPTTTPVQVDLFHSNFTDIHRYTGHLASLGFSGFVVKRSPLSTGLTLAALRDLKTWFTKAGRVIQVDSTGYTEEVG